MRRPARASRARHVPGVMNKNERAYADVLNQMQKDGSVEQYWFEGIKLRLGPNTFYTPDFTVQMTDHTIEMHEVKGGTKGKNGEWKPWAMEDANLKIKVAAASYPFIFRIAFRAGSKGPWMYREVC